jgi:hypothetical protein
VDELERRRLASERALLEESEHALSRAEDNLADAKEGRDSLISVSDIEELTGSIAREAARGAAEGFRKKLSDSVELSGPLGIKIKGTLKRILLLLVMVGIIFLIITLFNR